MRFQQIVSLAVILCATQAYGGAWTQPQGDTQLILSAATYDSHQLYNVKGRLRPQASYHKYELNPYIEYGYRDDLTLGSNISLQRTQGSSRADSNWGMGDSEFFIRKRLLESDGFVASVEPLIKLPSFQSSGQDIPKLGASHGDIALGLSTGYGFSAFQLPHFINLDTQYRYRLGAAKDQIKIAATTGFHVSSAWMIMPQAFVTYRTTTPRHSNFTQSSGDDYNLVRFQLSAVYALTDATSLQCGGFTDTDGKNAGRGKGVLLALWKHL